MKLLYNLAKKIRNQKVMQYIIRDDNHLDIGCGDGYLKRLSPAKNCIAFDGYAEQILSHLDNRYTLITMVAVMEHLDDPALILHECLRLLVNNGRIIITAPTWWGHHLTRIVSMHDFKEHKRVVTYNWLRGLIPMEYEIIHSYFECGLNQLFIIKRKYD